MKTYINGIGCIAAQRTFDGLFADHFECKEDNDFLPIVPPVYKDYISPVAIRRMAKGVKNGIVGSSLAMAEADISDAKLDAIITGTGMGCIEDSDKFLTAILDNDEEFLTPTSFIQSTHNTVGAQIALGLQCKAYNFTYVNGAVSFESALMDAKMQIDNSEASSILIGGMDEMTEYTLSLFKLAGFIKNASGRPYKVLNSKSNGVVFSEGATFFVLETEKKASSYAQILDVALFNRIDAAQVSEKALEFLEQNNIKISDIDAIVLGFNGDARFDHFYHELATGDFASTPQVYYKHLCGEYNTASAFGLYVGANVVKQQHIPEILSANAKFKPAYQKILLYNQYRGGDHSFILINQC